MKAWVAIAGNIGAGKSTLAKIIGEELGWDFYQELAEPNPFLEDFYADPKRWALASQLHFFTDAIRTACQIDKRGTGAVQDRSLYEHYHIFAKDLYSNGDLSLDEWQTLSSFYYTVDPLLPSPDLLLYLDAPLQISRQRIQARGREFEQTISDSYLQRLDDRYRTMLDLWTRSPILSIAADRFDYHNDEDRSKVIQNILQVLENNRPNS
jgi:deoxyadenosine/deoxycytidine kinase